MICRIINARVDECANADTGMMFVIKAVSQAAEVVFKKGTVNWNAFNVAKLTFNKLLFAASKEEADNLAELIMGCTDNEGEVVKEGLPDIPLNFVEIKSPEPFRIRHQDGEFYADDEGNPKEYNVINVVVIWDEKNNKPLNENPLRLAQRLWRVNMEMGIYVPKSQYDVQPMQETVIGEVPGKSPVVQKQQTAPQKGRFAR